MQRQQPLALLWQIVAAVFWFKVHRLQQIIYTIKMLDLHSNGGLDSS